MLNFFNKKIIKTTIKLISIAKRFFSLRGTIILNEILKNLNSIQNSIFSKELVNISDFEPVIFLSYKNSSIFSEYSYELKKYSAVR